MKNDQEMTVLGGGCFWCTEAVFRGLRGVTSVTPGYAGGTVKNPTYEQVCTGQTGHVEGIKIEYNPKKISFRDLLNVFFATHDPTTPNLQGNDIGSQYRSIILTTTLQQEKEAKNFIQELDEPDKAGKKNHQTSPPIVTEVKPLEVFYEAEKYHHQYYQKNPWQPYCQMIINPKLEKVKTKFHELLQS